MLFYIIEAVRNSGCRNMFYQRIVPCASNYDAALHKHGQFHFGYIVPTSESGEPAGYYFVLQVVTRTPNMVTLLLHVVSLSSIGMLKSCV